MLGHANHVMKALGVALILAAPAAADQFELGVNFGQGRGGTQVGVGFSWSNRPIVAAPVVAAPVAVAPAPLVARPVVVTPAVPQRVWVPTVKTVYRDVPVYDTCGRLVSYRREATIVRGGYWAEVPRPVAVHGSVGVVGHNHPGNWNKGHDEWRDRDDHRDRGQLQRYPAVRTPNPVKVVRGR